MAHDINFDRFLPEGQHLYPFQHAGVAYAVWQSQHGLGTMIADEQGLGKTIQAIVAAKVAAAIRKQEAEATKVLIIGKAALKLNWAREINRAAPEWDVQILAGKRPYELIGNVAIISFNLLKVWADALIAEGFTTLIIDESHCVKDARTQQTKAAMKIAADIRSRQGLVLLLSGTPLLNRPVELVSQLQIMGRIEEISPPPRYGTTDQDWEFAFKNSFCNPTKVQRGRKTYTEYKGSSREDLLSNRLRNRCMIRRLRKEVLSMEDTHRVPVSLSLNGDLDPYWQIEEHFVAKDPRSEALELLTALRQSVALCKIPAAVEWVQDFLEENDGKKLVVWAWHVEVQQAITAALNAAGIEAIYLKGEQDKGRIEEAKARFNEGSAQVIVCSLQAHREGHTLVGNGSNVTDSCFVELPWHPGALSQAEDRINRIGQNADVVFAHNLTVPGTVDQWLAELIDEKWATFRGVVNGTIVDAESQSVRDAVAAKLAAHLAAKYPAKYGHLVAQEGDLA
jgi:SWI/SNF-related matrix-associated actin-dependent regulator 1 of chromatin subfamily A